MFVEADIHWMIYMCNGEVIIPASIQVTSSIINDLKEIKFNRTQTSSNNCSEDYYSNDNKDNYITNKTHLNLILLSKCNDKYISPIKIKHLSNNNITTVVSISWLIDTICEQNIQTNINKYIIQLK